ncbi:MAG: 7-cyano-7-deazaguanine synthase [Vicinamibacterales bacterium]|nr:7-cyano-7-deazaguanine synthase [Vicinamibacterales bacterium]
MYVRTGPRRLSGGPQCHATCQGRSVLRPTGHRPDCAGSAGRQPVPRCHSPTFFDTMARALSLGLDHAMQIVSPFSHLSKADVIRLGIELGVPFALTRSCMDPADAHQCGRCSKCRERLQAFVAAGLADPAEYVEDGHSKEPGV